MQTSRPPQLVPEYINASREFSSGETPTGGYSPIFNNISPSSMLDASRRYPSDGKARRSSMESTMRRSSLLRVKDHDLGQAGVGLVFVKEDTNDHPVVAAVTADGSASRDGQIHVGDRITRVQGQSTFGVNTEALAERILGPYGSSVSLSFVRPGEEREFVVTLIRGSPIYWHLTDQIQILQKTIETLDMEKAKIRSELEQLLMNERKQHFTELTEKSKRHEVYVSELNAQHQQYIESMSQKHESALQQNTDRFMQQIESTKKEHINQMTQAAKNFQATIDEYKKQYSELTAEEKKQHAQTISSYEKMQLQLMTEKETQIAQMHDSFNEKLETYNLELRAKSEVLESQQNQNVRLNHEIQSLRAKITSLDEELKKAGMDMKDKQDTIEAIKFENKIRINHLQKEIEGYMQQ
eukprot:520964-Hanusia_phi.AAC.1